MPVHASRPSSGVLRYILRTSAAKQAVLMALVVLSVLLGLAPIHLMRLILDQVIPRGDKTLLTWVAIALGAVVLLRAAVGYCQTMVGEQIRQLVIARMRSELFGHVLRLGPDFFTRNAVGKIMNRVQTDVGRLGMSVEWIFVQPVVEAVTFVVYAAYLLAMNWVMALLAVASLPVVAVIVPSINRRLSRLSKDFTARMGSYGGGLQESLSGAFETQVHGAFAYEQDRIDRKQQDVIDTWLDIMRHNAWLTVLADLSKGVGPALVCTYGAVLAMRGAMTVGEIVAFVSVLAVLYVSVDKLIKYPPLLKNAEDRFEELREYLDLPPAFVDRGASQAGHGLARGAVPVRLESVSYRYEPSRLVLDGVTVDIAAGEHVAWVGRSGCGKSTAINVIAGRLLPESGAARIDGTAVSQLDARALARGVGYVGQTPFLFSTTIRNNLLYSLLRKQGHDPSHPGTYLDIGPLGVGSAADAQAIDAALIEAGRQVGFEQDMFELGLQARVGEEQGGRLLEVRRALIATFVGDEAIEHFEPGEYLARGTVLENLMFAPRAEERADEEAGRAWANALRRADAALSGEIASIGWESVCDDLDYLARMAAERPKVLAEFGIDGQDLDERVRLAERARGKAITVEALGEETFQSLIRRGLGARTDDPSRRARIVAGREAFRAALGEPAIRPYDPSQWHAGLSVRENLLFGRTDGANASAEKRFSAAIRAQIEKAGLSEVVLGWALDFDVGERGSRLSGGQRQKVSLARVLLKAPSLLLLDEVTASLDQDSARRVFALIRERLAQCTIIAVTHQLAWLDRFDRVMVFDAGRVVEQGSPTELRASGPVFRALIEAASEAAGE